MVVVSFWLRMIWFPLLYWILNGFCFFAFCRNSDPCVKIHALPDRLFCLIRTHADFFPIRRLPDTRQLILV